LILGERFENGFEAIGPIKTVGIAVIMTDKVDFKLKSIRRDKESCIILINGTIHQEEIIIVNIYEPNVSAYNFIKQIPLNLKALIDHNTMTVGDFSISPSPTDMSSR
jgi:hypothetical protein